MNFIKRIFIFLSFFILILPQTILALQPLPSQKSDFVFHGWGKLRLEHISSSDSEIGGLYGEPLEETSSISHRFFLEGSTIISSNFKVGALIRLSNEDDSVLLNGPVYFENKYGSIFAQASFNWIDFRLGYYEIFFTPLTLMRFDPKDLPEVGGSSGCSTCTSKGGLIGGSLLEDVEEKLTFEGGVLNADISDYFNVKAIYARSQQPVEGDRYRRHTLGARAVYQYYLSNSMDSFILSLQYVYHDDEGCSIDTPPPYYPLTNHVGSIYVYYSIY
ncbi:MAG: hypothetical protein HQK76_17620 [Desulfobacterales bacterium]|nr:hypothetical protein [Desulfobacterales bacterium]